MYNQEDTGLLCDWDATYGSTYAYKGLFGGSRLLTTDPTALSHILSRPDTYQKPDFVRDNLVAMGAGDESLLITEGNVHRRQRRILSPAFTAVHVKRLIPVFRDKASELRDIWILISKDHSKPIDVLMWLSRVTLDVIGIAVIQVLDTISTPSRAQATSSRMLAGLIFTTANKLQLRTILETWIPLLRKFRSHSETMEQARLHLIRVSLQLIDERKTTINIEEARLHWNDKRDYSLTPTEPDLLSVLVQSNMAPFASQRMTTSEVLSQISTFLIAGYETSSSALTWCLYVLATAPQCQNRLREAIRTIASNSPTLHEDISRLEYLDWVVRETLRFNAPVTWTMRVAMEDDEIPVQRPFWDKYGVLNTTIKMAKNDIITIPIQAINKATPYGGRMHIPSGLSGGEIRRKAARQFKACTRIY